ncbi:MAG: S46 family peptidase, partial [Bacteroidales bacterium]|nr:S46 family peptidase [Bacteroidales bacterium]
MKKIILLLTAFVLFAQFQSKADEGMWLLSLLKKNYSDMKKQGFKLTPEDIYSLNKASLKDAIVIFGRGCTGEIVSNQGLLLTNHHCGYGSIQSQSSVEHNYLRDGFWAKDFK